MYSLTHFLRFLRIILSENYYEKDLDIVTMLTQPQNNQQKIALLVSKDQLNRAKELCIKLLRKTPQDINLNNLLGIILLKMRRHNDALDVLQTALNLTSTRQQKATICNTLGQVYKTTNINKALDFQMEAVELNPLAEHLSNLADIELKNGLDKQALIHAKSAVLKNSQYLQGWETLCRILFTLERYSECLEMLEELPVGSNLRLHLSIDACIQNNDPKNALVYIETLSEKGTKLSDSEIEHCFNSYEMLGLNDKAKKFIQQNRPKQFEYRALLDLQAANVTSTDLQDIIYNLENKNVSLEVKKRISFAIANYYKKTDRKKWFDWLNKANCILPEGYKYDEQSVFTGFDNAIVFPYQNVPISLNKSRTPIFIIGMPRSGTTLCESILGAHSNVFACGESSYLKELFNGGKRTTGHASRFAFLNTLNGITQTDIDNLAHSYLKKMRLHDTSAEHLVDKMPHNFVLVGLIGKLFPQAKIIHMKRNPIANILSLFEQSFSGFHAYASSIESLIRYYQKYQTYMQKMQTLVPEGQLFELSYDELVSDPETQVSSLLEFCGLPFEDNCMNFQEQARTVTTASHHQVRQGFYTSSLKPWEGLEEQLADLLDAFPDAH
jgi:tetratricopeptide (TPR) repeat protein